MEMDTLQEMFIDELKDVLSAEKQLTKALPKMAKAATDPKLKTAFEDHLEQTKGHIERLEQVFEIVEKKPIAKTCKAMQGLVEEGSEIIEEDMSEEVKDAALIAAAQKVEHYEIATYGTLATWAKLLGMKNAEKLLRMTLKEEGDTDHKLTQLAESGINVAAA